MVNVIGVRFENAGKLYYFDPGALWPTPGDFVLVETSRGIEFGEVVTGVREIDDSALNSPLKPVVRIASAEDIQHAKDNKAAEKEAYHICQKKISEHKLDMKLVSVEFTFDNSKILFNFTANGRVDFRSLVKDLAGVFKTRIELRQIGVRDEARMLGGLGQPKSASPVGSVLPARSASPAARKGTSPPSPSAVKSGSPAATSAAPRSFILPIILPQKQPVLQMLRLQKRPRQPSPSCRRRPLPLQPSPLPPPSAPGRPRWSAR